MKNFKWDKKYLYWGVTAFCVVVASIAFFWMLNSWSGIKKTLDLIIGALMPVLYGFLIAYLLNKILVIFETRVFDRVFRKLQNRPLAHKLSRAVSITVTLLLALGLIAGLLIIVLPELYNSVTTIVTNSPEYFDVAMKWVENIFDGYDLEPVAARWLQTISDKLVDWLENNVLPRMSTLITSITGGVISVVMTIVDLFIGIVISVYLMYNKEVFCAQAKKLTYSLLRTKTANALMREIDFINDAFGNYIVGTLIDALIVGILNYAFMTIMGMPYSGLVTVIVAITNLIPVFGPFIGAVPSAFLILLENPTQSLIFLIFTVVLQQVDGQILKPRIHASRTGLSGFWIMFAILFFGGLFGIVGMVVGVPVTTVLYSLIRRLNRRRLRRRGLPEDTAAYCELKAIDPETKAVIPRDTPPEGPADPVRGPKKGRKKGESGHEGSPEEGESRPGESPEEPGEKPEDRGEK